MVCPCIESNTLQSQEKGLHLPVNGNLLTDLTRETDVHNDIAHITNENYAREIGQMCEMEMKASRGHQEFLQFYLSTSAKS